MIVAITGNIASGKSSASKIFEQEGYTLINADLIGHELYKIKRIRDKVVKRFGIQILTNKEIDRKKLKKIVFHNSFELIALNKIVHPEIIKEINKRINELSKNSKIAIEAALIIEFGFNNYDKLILVTVNRKQQIKRLLNQGRYTKIEILNIIKSQIQQEKKMQYADFIVDNSGTYDEFEKNVKKIIKELG